jgi:hypothetical protein
MSEEIAVIYGPNGTGRTSLIKVLGDAPNTKVEFSLDNTEYQAGAGVFHIINDQNNRNIISGETRDFFLGDNIRHEFELQDQVAADRNAFISALMSLIKNTFGITADALYALPFEQTAALPSEQTTMPYALPYEQLGFTADTAGAACIYEQHEPHDMRIAIHRPEWGENPEGFNILFHDSDVNGYYLVIMYFADEGRYHVSLDKGGVDCSFDIYPATDEKGWESPDLDTVLPGGLAPRYAP